MSGELRRTLTTVLEKMDTGKPALKVAQKLLTSSSGGHGKRAKEAIVTFSPKLTRDIESEQFCRQQLLLNIPHRDKVSYPGQGH